MARWLLYYDEFDYLMYDLINDNLKLNSRDEFQRKARNQRHNAIVIPKSPEIRVISPSTYLTSPNTELREFLSKKIKEGILYDPTK